ncbi:MAG: TIR domain-containing protein [Phycisphaerales bacterium]|nr:TIR domain-containing protein [Phycisphaerales bacterium]
MIDQSLNVPIDSEIEDYIMQKIREDYLADSTVTIHLIGANSAERLGWDEQRFIKRELQASLYNGVGNTRNGILGVVLPEIYQLVFKGKQTCGQCGGSPDVVKVNDNTVVREFSSNYYMSSNKCCYSEGDRYCVLTSWIEFCTEPNKFIDQAFSKRTDLIANKVVVFPNRGSSLANSSFF